MQDWIVINVTDILSATLRTKCPFGFGLRHFAADQNQNEIFSFWSVAVKMSGTSRKGGNGTFRRTFPEDQDCKMQTWSLVQRGGHFFRDVAKIRSAKCTFDFQRRILRLWTVTATWSAKCTPRHASSSVKLTLEAVCCWYHPSHSTLIHHKRASRYVVLGEISHSPFTTYIFILAWGYKNIRGSL